MALRNGLLVHGPTHWAAAVRRTTARSRSPRGPSRALRGLVERCRACAGWCASARRWPSSRWSSAGCPRPAALPGRQVVAATAAASVAGAALRKRAAGAAPARRRSRRCRSCRALVALRGGELAAYHGVEHKAIGAYEEGADDARDATKEHDRCGSHLMVAAAGGQPGGHDDPARRPEPGRSPSAGSAASSARRWRSSPGPSATPTAPRRGRCGAPGTSSRRAVGTREPTEEQLDVGRPRWPRSCASKAAADAGTRPSGQFRSPKGAAARYCPR
jgi:hypothetical protein